MTGRIASLAFSQRDPQRRGLVWPQQLRVTLALPDGPRTLEVALDGPRTVVTEAAGLPAPRYVLPNGGGWAYGGFVLDPASREYLATNVSAIPDALTRGAAWVSLWDALLDRDRAGNDLRRRGACGGRQSSPTSRPAPACSATSAPRGGGS